MNLESEWKVIYTRQGLDELCVLSKSVQKRIVDKVRFFALNDSLMTWEIFVSEWVILE